MARKCIDAFIDGVASLMFKLESSGCLGVTRLAGTPVLVCMFCLCL
jgi:hypothetical protein